MLKFKLMMLFAISLGLIGCDQVREKLVNGFIWGGTNVDPVNNNQRVGGSDDLQPKNDNKVVLPPSKPSYSPEKTANSSNPPAVVKIIPANEPSKPSNAPEKTPNSSNPPVVKVNPVNKPDKVTPQNRSNDIGGFRDNDW